MSCFINNYGKKRGEESTANEEMLQSMSGYTGKILQLTHGVQHTNVKAVLTNYGSF